VLKTGKSEGMQLMDDAIFNFYQQGLVSAQEAYMKAIDKQRFLPFLEEEQGKEHA
jgi:twitching motility protein PilT